jgi:23S rRNA (cytosine1962-C5)-methyltransferase
MAAIWLKNGRDKSVRLRHPWIFSGAIDLVKGDPQPGETVEVRSADGAWLAWAAYSPFSQIRGRIWSWDAQESIDADFIRARLAQAVNMRKALVPAEETNALRLVHGESDGLPGVVVDRYGGVLVLQILSTGAEAWRETLVDGLVELTGLEQVYERSDVDVRSLEGLPERTGALHGEPPSQRLVIRENGLDFFVDVCAGQKTGFYLDQRRNRQRVGALVSGRKVLNCFCYTGAFSVYALAGGAASVLSIDSSAEAIALASDNVALNGFPAGKASWLEGDVFHELRTLRDRAESFDAIILDPPKFAPTAAQAERAARGYKDINLLAFKLLRPGGLLFTFSCSGGISADLFQKIVAGAALDAGVDARMVEHLAQGPDHPVALNFPEGAYLKGLVCQVAG